MKLRTLILTASLGLVVAPGAWANTVLFDNIGKPVAHTDTISGPVWLAQSFITDGQSYTLDSATLLLRQTAPGSAQVDIYSGSSRPTIVVGILSSPAAYSASLTPVTFTASGISLAANSSYWVAIHGLGAGSYEWAWTQDNTGGGVGFSIPLAFSLDAGLCFRANLTLSTGV